jgi:hypothetical protein
MAKDEDMAIRFYQVGNARELADQMIAILADPQLEHDMAEQNFAAGVEMMMSNVVNNYLRWFRLNSAKRALNGSGVAANRSRKAAPDWKLQPSLVHQHEEQMDQLPGMDPLPAHSQINQQ